MTQHPTSRAIPKVIENIRPHKNLYTNVHSGIIIKTKKWKQPKSPSTDEERNKTWSVHAIGVSPCHAQA